MYVLSTVLYAIRSVKVGWDEYGNAEYEWYHLYNFLIQMNDMVDIPVKLLMPNDLSESQLNVNSHITKYVWCLPQTRLIQNTSKLWLSYPHFTRMIQCSYLVNLAYILTSAHILIIASEFVFVMMRNQDDIVLIQPQYRISWDNPDWYLVKMTSLYHGHPTIISDDTGIIGDHPTSVHN